jgi:alkylation response protein AidB-like acyl-CoA dehydrogenase
LCARAVAEPPPTSKSSSADLSAASAAKNCALATSMAQGAVIDLVLRVTTDLFEVGGASATSQRLQLDRYWRNARTVASHNPAIYRSRLVGDYLLNGVHPSADLRANWAAADAATVGAPDR